MAPEHPLAISDEIRQRIDGLVVIAGTVTVGDCNVAGIEAYLNSSWSALTDEVRESGPKAQPLIKSWREALMAAGISVKRRPPSIEAMARRAWKGHDVFSINPVVDTYNALSMELCLPLGAWDIGQMEGGLTLRLSEGGEPFQPLGAGDAEKTEPAEIVYSDSSDVLTRHFLWRQSDRAKITEHTERFVFVSELVETMGEDVLLRTRKRIEQQFTRLLDADVQIEFVR